MKFEGTGSIELSRLFTTLILVGFSASRDTDRTDNSVPVRLKMLEDKETTREKREINWMAVMYYLHLHIFSLYGIWLMIFSAKWMTIIFTLVLIIISFIGQTAGAHRHWAHNSYKATTLTKFLLMLAQTIGGTGTIYNWAISHRIHHKYYGTDKDPYNHKNGFWYSHVMSNILWRDPGHDEVVRSIDTRDVDGDLTVSYQHSLYPVLFTLFALLLPINTPLEYWDEDLVTSAFVVIFFRLTITNHTSTLINSGLLIWGLKSTDKYPPDDNLIFYLSRTFWLPYHYLAPWDYKTGEFGTYDTGLTTILIKVLYELNLASELKTSTTEEVREALYRLATKRVTKEQMLEELDNQATHEATKTVYMYHH